MTLPDPASQNLRSTGFFTDESPAAEKVRQKLAADAMQAFNTAQNDRWRQERQWYYNLAFYFGQHYVKFRNVNSHRRFDMYVPPAPYYRSRPVINQIRKVVRKEIARLTAQQPNAYIIPASAEDRDIFAAQAGEQIWGSLWRRLKFNATLRKAVFWQATCGNGFLKQWWDSQKIDKDNPDARGDISIKAETPFHIFVPDLKEENIEEQPFVIHAQVRNKAWVQSALGLEVSDHSLEVVDESLLNVLGINHQDRKGIVILLEVWVKPGVFIELPDGGMFTIAENKIVQGWEEWPYQHKEFPFSKLDAIPTGKFYNDSIVADLIPLQQELNRTRAQIVEAKNLMAKPQYQAEEGAVDARMITSEPGQVIFRKPGMAPLEPVQMQNLPPYVTEEINRLYTDIADLSGQHEVSQGQAPPGVTAATAISYLQEQDESIIASHFDSVEEAIEKTARHCLSYVHEFWDEPRTIKLAGLDNAFDVQTFRGSDLTDNTDIRVEAGSALPTSRAAKQAFITDLMKMGLIPPDQGLEVLELAGLNKIYERVQVDTRQAQRENLKMRVVTQEDILGFNDAWEQKPEEERTDPATGRLVRPPLIVPVNSFDNHQIHIDTHNRFRKSQGFEMADPIVKMLFEEHVRMHTEAMMGAAGMSAQLPPGMQDPLQPPPGGEAPPEQGMLSEQGMEQPPPMAPPPQGVM